MNPPTFMSKDPSVGINAAVAAELRAERGAQKITVEALAQRSGVPKRTLLRLLNAERGIAMEPLAAIAGALNVPVSLVVSRAEERLERGGCRRRPGGPGAGGCARSGDGSGG